MGALMPSIPPAIYIDPFQVIVIPLAICELPFVDAVHEIPSDE
jgi:hypothetical protein